MMPLMTPARPAIRDATPADADAVAGLLGELGYPCSASAAEDQLRRFTAQPRSRVQLAEVAGRVVGLVATHVVPRLDGDGPSCRITDLVVSQATRRSGIGTALVAAAEREARRQAAPRLDLSSGEWRADAHAFYDRLGFDAVSRGFTKRLR